MDDIQKEAKWLADKIAVSYKPKKIILFGSLARGENGSDADIDLLIVKESKKKRPFRIKEVFEVLRGLKRNFPLDALVYTPKELKSRVKVGDYFIKRILREGKILYG